MAGETKGVILTRRLRDQIYDLVRNELQNGELPSGRRIYEVDLAAKYGVSRTPVREALFQLTREGMLVAEDRGYSLPIENAKSITDRLEVHLLLTPRVAYHASLEGTDIQLKVLHKALTRSLQAHKAHKYKPFVETSHLFRMTLMEMCQNLPLRRCALLVEDQFLPARNVFFKESGARDLDINHHRDLLALIEARNGEGAERETHDYLLLVKQHLLNPTAQIFTTERAAKVAMAAS